MTDETRNSLGALLKASRERQESSLDEIAHLTKIRANIILSIENDELDVMPPAYMKGFVRDYAKFLKVPFDEYSPLLDAAFAPTHRFGFASAFSSQKHSTPQNIDARTNEQTKSLFNFLRPKGRLDEIPTVPYSNTPNVVALVNKLAYTALGLGAAAIGYYFIAVKPNSTNKISQSGGTTTLEISAPANAQSDASSATIKSIVSEPATPQDSIMLQARATDTVWVSIVTDGKSKQLTMKPEDTQQWSAYKAITLSLNNAGGIIFTLNGKQLEPLGRRGYIMRNIKINRKGLTTSSLTQITSEKPFKNTSTATQISPAKKDTVKTSQSGKKKAKHKVKHR